MSKTKYEVDKDADVIVLIDGKEVMRVQPADISQTNEKEGD